MSFEDIINSEYKTIAKSLNNVISNNQDYTIIMSDDSTVDNFLDVFGKNDKKVLTVKYEVLGTYDEQLNIFSWGCDNIIADKDMTKLAKLTKKYSKNIKILIVKKEFKDQKYLERMYYYLTNNMFFLESINLNDIIKLAVFITKTNGVIKKNTTSAIGNKIISLFFVTDIISY